MVKGQTLAEVFPDFQIPDSYQYIFHHTVVTRVLLSREKRRMALHVCSEQLVSRKQWNKIAMDLKKDLFGNNRLFVEIVDSYRLSSRYDLTRITRDYWESILAEVREMEQALDVEGLCRRAMEGRDLVRIRYFDREA